MDVLREAVGDDKLTYLGFSYGTFLGATYAALFPNRFRALVLDGALDAEDYLDDPLKISNSQTAAFERALGRFFQACAGRPGGVPELRRHRPARRLRRARQARRRDADPGPRLHAGPAAGRRRRHQRGVGLGPVRQAVLAPARRRAGDRAGR